MSVCSSVRHLWWDRVPAAGVCLPGMANRFRDPVISLEMLSVIRKPLTKDILKA